MNFLEEFLRATEDVESPTSFLTWAALSGVSTVLRDNVWIEIRSQMRHIYPNLYILLIGDSGEVRKGGPLKIISSLLRPILNTKVIEGRASIQGVIKELASVISKDGKTIKGASGLLYSEEFKSFLVKDDSTTALLTDLYDFHEEWIYTLKNEERMVLKNVCLNLLTASNAAFLKSMFYETDIRGGLVGRTIVVVESEPRKKSSGWEEGKDAAIPRQHLIDLLGRIAGLKGEVVPSQGCRRYYNDWYHNLDTKSIASGTGFEPRIHTHVLKVAVVIAACEDGWDMILQKSHIEKAIELLFPLVKNYKQIASTITQSTNYVANIATEIITILLKTPEMRDTRQGLLQKLIGKTDTETLDKALITLQNTGFVDISATGSDQWWVLSKKGLEVLMKELKTPPKTV